MSPHPTVDFVSRRGFLRAGVLSGLGLALPDYLRWTNASAAGGPADRSAIVIFLTGGPSHLDLFDLKPQAPAEVRGEFAPIPTNVPGLEICELLPRLARQADKFALLRSVAHTQAEHTLGQRFLSTGNSPNPALHYPVYGSVVGRERSSPAGVPPFVALSFRNAIDIQENREVETPGYLGAAAAPFQVKLGTDTFGLGAKTPKKDKVKGVTETPSPLRADVRALNPPSGLSAERLDARHALLNGLDATFRQVAARSQDLDGMDKFYQQAHDMLRAPAARDAFDLAREKPASLDLYGPSPFAQSCLVARRLIEAGVRCVSINFASWDAHGKIFPALRSQLPELDAGVAGLLHDLAERGLLESTAVLLTGEFGRTPKINGIAGRDHWSRAMSVLLAGAGLRGGQVIGATNANAEEPITDPITPQDIAHTLYHALGIDPTQEFHTPTGRPIRIVSNGQLIPNLLP